MTSYLSHGFIDLMIDFLFAALDLHRTFPELQFFHGEGPLARPLCDVRSIDNRM